MRYSHFLRLFFDGLSRIGIVIRPYYVYLESISESIYKNNMAQRPDYTLGFLKPEDMKNIAYMPGRNVPKKDLLRRLQEGKKCFGVKYRGEWVAFTWIDLKEFKTIGFRQPMKEDEAYIFDAFTAMHVARSTSPFLLYASAPAAITDPQSNPHW